MKGLLASGAMAGLGACGRASSPAAPPETAVATPSAPSRGGRLRAALAGSTDESLDPNTVEFSAADLARFNGIFDPLVLLAGGDVERVLAESFEPNADATRWTIRLRQGVTFHDGRPLRAADAAYSLRKAASDPKSPYANGLADLMVAQLRMPDEYTLEVPLARPRGDFEELISGGASVVLPDGTTDFTKPVGSGPFRLVSYEPGRTALLAANPDYFRGAPLVDELEVLTISDATARINALRAGQVDYVKDVTLAAARAEAANPDVQIVRGGPGNASALVVAMNTGLAPFDDPRVRHAFRLAVDRDALVDSVLFGFGEIGNDLLGKGLPGYAADLPQREYDPDQARRLLSEAGATNLSVSITTADVAPGVVDGAQVYAAQLEAVGVKASVDQLSVDAYYGDLDRNNSTPIQASSFVNRPIAIHIDTFVVSSALLNVTGWKRPAFDARFAEARATADQRKRNEILAELQRELYEEGGEIVWGFVQGPDAARKGVTGVTYAQTTPLFGNASLG